MAATRFDLQPPPRSLILSSSKDRSSPGASFDRLRTSEMIAIRFDLRPPPRSLILSSSKDRSAQYL